MSAETEDLNFDGKKPKVWQTHDVKKALLAKYTDRGEYLVLFEVQDSAGMAGRQYCDAVVIGNWASTGREIWGMEIKASRSDWLRELKKADKSDRFTSQCDRWWLVTTSRDIIKPAELPHDWGWMNMTKVGGLRIEKTGSKLPHASEPGIRRGWAYALMRRAAERTGDDLERALQVQRAEFERRHQEELQREIKRAQIKDNGPLEILRAKVDKFEKASGIKLEDYRMGDAGEYVGLMKDALGWRDRADFIRDLNDSSKALAALAAALGSIGTPRPETNL